MSRSDVHDSSVAAEERLVPGLETLTRRPSRRSKPLSADAPASDAAPRTAATSDVLVSLSNPHSFEAEQYRTLGQIVESRRNVDKLQVVAVSSAGIGDGKTTTTLNLAGALAQSAGSRVLLIDGDLRRPSIASQLRLGCPGRHGGLAGAIRREAVSLAFSVHRLPRWNLSVLTAGDADDKAYELLKSARFARLIEEARREFEFVLIDCPPLLAVPDCRVIERVVDGFLLVVSADGTPRKLVEEALNVLSAKNMIGIVFNRDRRPLSGYYGYYGRYYGVRNGSRTS